MTTEPAQDDPSQRQMSVADMPPAPKGMVWVLRLNALHDDAMIWLYKKSRFTEQPSKWSIACKGLQAPDWPTHAGLSVSTASIDEIVEATVMAARKLVVEVNGEPARKAEQDAKAAELSRRLGIKVEVK